MPKGRDPPALVIPRPISSALRRAKPATVFWDAPRLLEVAPLVARPFGDTRSVCPGSIERCLNSLPRAPAKGAAQPDPTRLTLELVDRRAKGTPHSNGVASCLIFQVARSGCWWWRQFAGRFRAGLATLPSLRHNVPSHGTARASKRYFHYEACVTDFARLRSNSCCHPLGVVFSRHSARSTASVLCCGHSRQCLWASCHSIGTIPTDHKRCPPRL